MRGRPDWMNRTDDRILELLAGSGLICSPDVVAINLQASERWVSRRLSRLRDAGFVEAVDEDYYAVTDEGEAYLSRRGR